MKVQMKIIDKEYYNYFPEKNDFAVVNHPKYETAESAGMDLRTMVDFILPAGEQKLVSTGLAIHISDKNVCAHVLPRSGLGHKQGIVLGNLVGLIDSDYQGELMLSIWNRGHEVRYFQRGDRLAQLVFMPIIRATLEIVDEFQTSDRGVGGFGSTGV